MEQNNLVFEVDGIIYELIYNFKDAFQKEWFEEKLVDVLKNKPYIVGDISHDKLRLSGFTLTKDNNNPKNINNLEDYILEYCNFGAPFFVVTSNSFSLYSKQTSHRLLLALLHHIEQHLAHQFLDQLHIQLSFLMFH